MVLYMAVTPDEYELPIFVTESYQELAMMLGFKRDIHVLQAIAKHRRCPPKTVPKLIRVRCEESRCAICGTEFDPKMSKQRYCGRKCCEQAAREMWKKRSRERAEGRKEE